MWSTSQKTLFTGKFREIHKNNETDKRDGQNLSNVNLRGRAVSKGVGKRMKMSCRLLHFSKQKLIKMLRERSCTKLMQELLHTVNQMHESIL